jgi:predicted transcriptional regulator
MACVNPDGSITESAKALLQFLSGPANPEQIAKQIGQPLFKVRSSLREMSEAGLVKPSGEMYEITARGKAKL